MKENEAVVKAKWSEGSSAAQELVGDKSEKEALLDEDDDQVRARSTAQQQCTFTCYMLMGLDRVRRPAPCPSRPRSTSSTSPATPACARAPSRSTFLRPTASSLRSTGRAA